MSEKTPFRFEEITGFKSVSFSAVCKDPEAIAMSALRDWAIKNISDYEARRYIGFAPKGHHPDGNDSDFHAYEGQMILYGSEGGGRTFMGAEVTDAPAGLYIVGDVIQGEYKNDGTVDIGLCMQKASQRIFTYIQNTGDYDLDLGERPFLEEYLYPKEWFSSDNPSDVLADLKLWLPIKKHS